MTPLNPMLFVTRWLLAGTICTFTALAGAAEWPLAGHWQLNLEESDKVAESYEEGSGAGKPKLLNNVSVNVGGLPLPSLGGKIPPQSSLTPKNPQVLLCTTMAIHADKKKLTLEYDGVKTERMRKGHYRGRDTTWSKKKIQQKYKTPDRKVTKTWSLRPDGRLLVEVKLNPPKDKSRTFRRVFDRVDPDALQAPVAGEASVTPAPP